MLAATLLNKNKETALVKARPTVNSRIEMGQRFDGLTERFDRLTGYESTDIKNCVDVLNTLRARRLVSFSKIMSLVFKLQGRPYTIRDHFPFEPFFRTHLPQQMLLITGRQVSKSTTLAVQGIMMAISIPHFNTLCVTPLFEMIRRFSQNYVRMFLENSVVKHMFTDTTTAQNVLQRSFTNGSMLQFSYAFLDAERTRGISCSRTVYDEIQNLNYDFIPVIREAMSASPWKVELFAGTPKSLANTINRLHMDSSQAEWVIPCLQGGCNYQNVPALEYDLWDMIGPMRDDISEEAPGCVCAKCRKPLQPRRGRWVHAIDSRKYDFAGYHIPQIIMPMHYADKNAWAKLVGKMQGRGNTTQQQFLNEVCGVSSDEGAKLVSLSDLRAAACLSWKNHWREAAPHADEYTLKVLACDWGGGGGRLRSSGKSKEEEGRERSSFTTLAVMGLLPSGRIDVLWGYRSLRTHDWEWEARLCIETLVKFKCNVFAHDYSNAGVGRELMMIQAGWPTKQIMPIRYHGSAAHGWCTWHRATKDHPRDWYSLDRTYTLVTTCHAIKQGVIRFFQDDYETVDSPGVLRDFLSLVEEKVDGRVGTDVFTIQRNPNMPDDFAHAVNYGASALWYMSDGFPDFAALTHFKINPAVRDRILHPPRKVNWDDID